MVRPRRRVLNVFFFLKTTWQVSGCFNYTAFHFESQTLCDAAVFFFFDTNHFKSQEFHNWLPGDKTMFDFSLEAMYSVRLLALRLG